MGFVTARTGEGSFISNFANGVPTHSLWALANLANQPGHNAYVSFSEKVFQFLSQGGWLRKRWGPPLSLSLFYTHLLPSHSSLSLRRKHMKSHQRQKVSGGDDLCESH